MTESTKPTVLLTATFAVQSFESGRTTPDLATFGEERFATAIFTDGHGTEVTISTTNPETIVRLRQLTMGDFRLGVIIGGPTS